MDVNTVTHIVNLVCQQNRLVDGIILLRKETKMGLFQAKQYLQEGKEEGETCLYNKLCSDFVQNTSDLLLLARIEMQRWMVEVERLERLLITETEAEDFANDLKMGVIRAYKWIPGNG